MQTVHPAPILAIIKVNIESLSSRYVNDIQSAVLYLVFPSSYRPTEEMHFHIVWCEPVPLFVWLMS